MREFIRPVAGALAAVSLTISLTVLCNLDARAQQAPSKQGAPAQAAPSQPPPQMKQIALTDKQVEGALAATKEMDPITAKLPDNAKPDPKVVAQLDAIARKNGFASYDDYSNVVDTIGLVLGGFDPQSKKYVGPEALIKSQIAQLEADKKMSAQDKKEALADLNDGLKSPPPPVENKANIDLVTKYYDRLAEAFGGNEQE